MTEPVSVNHVAHVCSPVRTQPHMQDAAILERQHVRYVIYMFVNEFTRGNEKSREGEGP